MVRFNSNDALEAANDAINAKSPTWIDPSNNQEVKVYAKRDKDIEKRKIGQFRSHFYTAFEQYFKNHVDYMNKEFKVEIVNNKLYITMDNDSTALLTFTPKVVQDRTGIEMWTSNLGKFGITPAAATTMIDNSLAAATAAEQSRRR